MNLMDFLEKHIGRHVRVVMRRDASSGEIPDAIEGELLFFDPRSGLLIVNQPDRHLLFSNRGAISYVEIRRSVK